MSLNPVVGFLGNSDGRSTVSDDFRKLMESIGENTGNLMFQHACWNLIKNDKVQFRLGVDLDIEHFKSQIDVLFIPAANQLNADWDLEDWATLIEILDRPVVIAGLGAQARVGETAQIDLKDGTRRFLEVLSDKAVYIGVRGESTLNLLRKYGIRSGVVTGCPSNFISHNVSGKNIARQIRDLSSKGDLRVNYVFGTMEDYARSFECELFRLWNNVGGNIIYQTDEAILRLLYDGFFDERSSAVLEWQSRALKSSLDLDEYINLIKTKGLFYTDAAKWVSNSREIDLTIGMRIHGTVAAIQSGSLGVCVPFDSRTMELVETMGYPHVLPEDLSLIQNYSDLPEYINFSAYNFDARRNMLRTNLKMVMEQSGILTTL